MQTVKEVIAWLQCQPQDEPLLVIGLWAVEDVIDQSKAYSEDGETETLSRGQAIEAMNEADRIDEWLTNEDVQEIIRRRASNG